MLFWSVCRKYFAWKSKFSRTMDIKDWTLFLNCNSFFILKIFPWTRKMHFWQPRWKSFARMKDNFYSLLENDEDIYFQTCFFSICFFGHVEDSFANFDKKDSTKERSPHADNPRKRILILYTRVKSFPQNNFFDSSNALLTTDRKNFDKEPEIFAQ